MDNMKDKKIIAVVGLGYIGIPFCVSLANVGFRVIGVDIDEKKVKKLHQSYTSEIYEPGVNEGLQRCRDSIEFTTSYKYALERCNAIFLTVGTPLKAEDEPDYSYLDSALDSIGQHLQKGQVVVLKSTVALGTTEEHVVQKLEKQSKLKAGTDFFLAFCPERTIEGLALHELYNLPKIVGGINQESSQKVAEIVERLGSKVIIVSRPMVAEMCKLLDNLFRSVNIAFANEVGMVCEKLGLNSHEVISAVNNAYSRTRIFSPGLGADGPCLSKDPMIFRYSAHKYGIVPAVTEGAISTNLESTLRIASLVSGFIEEKNILKPKIGIVGLAFKGFPETDDMRGSPAIKIKDALVATHPDAVISYYDPIVSSVDGEKVEASIADCIKNCNVIMFLTNHRRIMNLDAKAVLAEARKPCLVIDAWQNLKNIESVDTPDIMVFRIGVGDMKK
ncbi:MAG: nucleotide sugar dehydrogenase [Candidatus Woesearchaeota archaeon]